jgi:hypothetical protein
VAVNCSVCPLATLGFAGVTLIDTNVALVTVNAVLPVRAPKAAAMVVEPTAIEVARPLVPVTLLTVATPALDEDHVTCAVRFCVELSE